MRTKDIHVTCEITGKTIDMSDSLRRIRQITRTPLYLEGKIDFL